MSLILTSQLPSGGYGYEFPSINVNPMSFIELTKYLEGVPKDPLDKYLYDIESLVKENKKILDCYVMDVDFLIFYKKLITVSGDLTYIVTIKCPDCGNTIKKKINLETDVHFKGLDEKIMNGAYISFNNGHKYETIVPTIRDFLKVFETYLRVRKIEDLKIIKTIALIKDFEFNGNQIENDVLGATHEDITLLTAFQDLYYDRVEPIEIICDKCKTESGERRKLTASIDNLVVDFFRDLCINCPIDVSKVVFK